ncbi:MAG: hypothetical protein ACYDBJ_24000 [Aggregatilineales bacterium]
MPIIDLPVAADEVGHRRNHAWRAKVEGCAEATGRRWQILDSDPAAPDQWPDAKPFGLSKPTLRWQAGGQLSNLYVAGTTAAQFLSDNELALALRSDGRYELVTAEVSPWDVVISPESDLGGAVYPFLEQTGRAWAVVSSRIEQPASYPRPGTFGMVKPTLRYVKDNKVEDLFVDGMTTSEFLAKTGLQLSLDKGGFVLSKRLSRLMRPHFAYGHFPQESVRIRYLTGQSEDELKVWDGAGLMSRAMLRRLVIPPHVSAAKRAELEREIEHCERVEFTILTASGQDKGHAIVSDDLADADFVLPVDTKHEVRLVNGQTFVGVNFVHAEDSMRLDVQSLINLYPFFDEQQLGQWLDEEGNLFAHAVESGQVDEALRRIDPYATLDDIEAWSLREYFASGGHAMWFATPARNLMNQHLKRLNETTLGKLRLPIPGGRYYVMPIGVGQAAGFEHDVPRGQVRIDKRYATAWVNDEDWVQLESSSQGIRNVLGGADNDDALWLHLFTDYDGVQKALTWRSPNQAGEYVVLEPTIGSYIPEWRTLDGPVLVPPGDSRKLFPRTDSVAREYLGLVGQAEAPQKGQSYSVEVMGKTISRANANAAALGLYCNLLMVSKGLYGTLPKHPPAPLEDIIDATVKTGADVSRVREWCFEASRRVADSGVAIPALLLDRLALSESERQQLPRTSDHWTDKLHAILTAHIEAFRARRNDLVARVAPPALLFDHAFNAEDRAAIPIGKQLNSVYSKARTAVLRSKVQGEALTDADNDQIRRAVEGYLAQFPDEQRNAILRGALIEAHLSDKHTDGALWLPGVQTETGRAPGIAQQALRALREIGVLDEIAVVDGQVIAHPGGVVSEPDFQGSVGLNGVWFNWYRRAQAAAGEPLPVVQRDVPKDRAKWAKAEIARLAGTAWQGLSLSIRREDDRLKAYTIDGELFGFVSRDSAPYVAEGPVQLGFAFAADGNLRAVWRSPVKREPNQEE